MTFIDAALLAEFRGPGKCPWCERSLHLEPHHLWTRGLGGGQRLDVRWNLTSLCRECHQAHHDGHRPFRVDLLACVAKREGISPRTITQAVYWCQRVPNGATPAQVRAELETLGPAARKLVRVVLRSREAA